MAMVEGERSSSLGEEMLAPANIRSASERDLEQIVHFAYLLELDLQKHDPKRAIPSMEELRNLYVQRLQNNENGFTYGIFVAERNDQVVGYAIGKVPVNREPPFYALFQGSYVDKGFRRQGIGNLLSQRITLFAEQHGATSVVSYVHLGGLGEMSEIRNGKSLESIDSSQHLAKYTLHLRPRVIC